MLALVVLEEAVLVEQFLPPQQVVVVEVVLQLLVQLEGADGRSAMMALPETATAENATRGTGSSNGFKLAFKYFHRAEGAFRVPAGAKVVSVQVRIFEAGSTQPRASQLLKLS